MDYFQEKNKYNIIFSINSKTGYGENIKKVTSKKFALVIVKNDCRMYLK